MNSKIDPAIDYYSIVGVETTATEAEIRKAFKQKALKTHPDRFPNDPTAKERFEKLNEAYKVLTTPELRKKVDELKNQLELEKKRQDSVSQERQKIKEKLLLFEQQAETRRSSAMESEIRSEWDREAERMAHFGYEEIWDLRDEYVEVLMGKRKAQNVETEMEKTNIPPTQDQNSKKIQESVFKTEIKQKSASKGKELTELEKKEQEIMKKLQELKEKKEKKKKDKKTEEKKRKEHPK